MQSVELLNDYLQQLTTDQDLLESDVLSDFLAANWDGKDLKFMNSLEDFMYMLLKARYEKMKVLYIQDVS